MVRNTPNVIRETLHLKWERVDGLSKGSRMYAEYRFYQAMPTGQSWLLIHTMRAGGDVSFVKAKQWFNNKHQELIAAAMNAREAKP